MKRPEKEAVVAQLTEQFRNADAVYLTEYRGLTVPQVSELREKLGRDTSYTVAKNTLARIAAKEAGIEGLDDLLKGPTAITFVKGDFIEAAKTLRDFAKTNKALMKTFTEETAAANRVLASLQEDWIAAMIRLNEDIQIRSAYADYTEMNVSHDAAVKILEGRFTPAMIKRALEGL